MRYNVIDKIENIVFLHQEEREVTENGVTSLQLFYDFDEAPENTERYDFVPITYPYTADYLEPRFNFDTLVWYEGATQQEVIAKQIEKETRLYEKRIQDGIKSVAQVSAENRVYRLSGAVSSERLNEIETLTEPVRREILAGQWVSAKRILEEIGIEALGEPPYVRYHTEITNYIAENYD